MAGEFSLVDAAAVVVVQVVAEGEAVVDGVDEVAENSAQREDQM